MKSNGAGKQIRKIRNNMTQSKPKKPKGRPKNPDNNKTFAKNIDGLCKAIGISRGSFDNYKTHPEFPYRYSQGYCIEDWQEFLKKQGLGLKTSRTLKEQLTQLDIQLRQIAIDEKRGNLIPKGEHERQLLSLTQLFKQSLNQIPLQMQAAFPENKHIQMKAQSIIDGILKNIIDGVKGMQWEQE